MTYSGDVNIFARHGGVVHCQGCSASNAADTSVFNGTAQSLGANFMAEAGGHLYVDGSTGAGARVLGFGARTSGSLWAHNVTVTGSAGNGIQIDEGGSGEVGGSVAHGNAFDGIYVTSRGWANVDGVNVYGNGRDGIVADGGSIGGLSPRAANNGTGGITAYGYGFRSINGGSLDAYGGVAASTTGLGAAAGNVMGLKSRDLGSDGTGSPCSTSDVTTNCIPASHLFVN